MIGITGDKEKLSKSKEKVEIILGSKIVWISCFVVSLSGNSTIFFDMCAWSSIPFFEIIIPRNSISFLFMSAFFWLNTIPFFKQISENSFNSVQLTAFSTPNGHYEWLVMPFGLKNAPQIFQRKMDKIFSEKEFLIVYIDDILICSKTYEEHLTHLIAYLMDILSRIKIILLTLQKEKHIFQNLTVKVDFGKSN